MIKTPFSPRPVRALPLAVVMVAVAGAQLANAHECVEGARDEIACLYANLRKEASDAARPAMAADEQAWRQQEKAPSCKANCTTESEADRVKRLRALDATVSNTSGTFDVADAVWLEGEWKVGDIVAVSPIKAPASVPDLPAPGSVLNFKAGAACDAKGACQSFGLGQQKIGARRPRQKLATLLGVPNDWPYYLVYTAGRPDYALVPTREGHVLAITIACEGIAEHCGYVRQEWVPAGSAEAKIVVRTPVKK